MPDAIVTRLLRVAGYAVYAHELDETTSRLTLWIRQAAEEPYYVCGGVGFRSATSTAGPSDGCATCRGGPGKVWLVLEVHRVRCPRCGVRTERLPFLTGKAPYTTRLEAVIARECEAAPVSRVARAWQLPPETVRRLDKRVLRRWAAGPPRTPLRFLGVDEISLGRRDKFLNIVSDLDTGDPPWAGRDRKREPLDRFFADPPSTKRGAPNSSARAARPARSCAANGGCCSARGAISTAASASKSASSSPSIVGSPKRISSRSNWPTSGITSTRAPRGASSPPGSGRCVGNGCRPSTRSPSF